MPITLGELATAVAGTLVGDAAALPLAGAATLEAAAGDEITLVDAADKLHRLAKSRAGAAIVPPGTGPLDRPTIEVGDVHAAFATRRRFDNIGDNDPLWFHYVTGLMNPLWIIGIELATHLDSFTFQTLFLSSHVL